jgi:acyl-CoA thioesterase II
MVSAARERDSRLVDRMLALFDLERVGPNAFRIPGAETEPRRLFGGQLVAQALAAATRTVEPERKVNSLHAYFVRTGTTAAESRFEVARDADGSTFSFRRVVMQQAGTPLLTLSALFQTESEGLAHQEPPPAVPPPEALQDDHITALEMKDLSPAAVAAATRGSPFQFRSVLREARFSLAPAPAQQLYWLRVARPVPEADQAMQRVLLTYASDTLLAGTGLMPHGLRWFEGNARVASLDHALWIHRDVRVDDWLLYQQDSPWGGEGRNLMRGQIFDRQGRLVASVAQEGSMGLAKAPRVKRAESADE